MPNVVSLTASIAELAHAENHLLSHLPSLFDAPGTEVLTLRNIQMYSNRNITVLLLISHATGIGG